MSRLADPIENLQQYLATAGRIRRVIALLTVDLLTRGTSVVFDFAGNTVDRAKSHRIDVRAAEDDLSRRRFRTASTRDP